jgi:hypothetical protein
MKGSAIVCLVLVLLAVAMAGQDKSIESVKADMDVALNTDPFSSFVRTIHSI